MMWGGHWMYGGFMIFFWILIIMGLVFLIKWIVDQGRSDRANPKENALEILKKRYAKGEISKEEFEEKKKEIVD
ncbi:MAG: SHOCT domain-containing protein [Candidatus Aminicenantales bacterium]